MASCLTLQLFNSFDLLKRGRNQTQWEIMHSIVSTCSQCYFWTVFVTYIQWQRGLKMAISPFQWHILWMFVTTLIYVSCRFFWFSVSGDPNAGVYMCGGHSFLAASHTAHSQTQTSERQSLQNKHLEIVSICVYCSSMPIMWSQLWASRKYLFL